MREEFQRWVDDYPKAPRGRDSDLAGSPLQSLVRSEIPQAIQRAVAAVAGKLHVQGSVGKGSLTHTPWVALLDPAVTTTVEEGYYVVYLLSRGCERLYLTLNQGCTTLKESGGLPIARAALEQRADVMWARVQPQAKRLWRVPMDLSVSVWRGKLYERGVVAGVRYETARLPANDELIADLEEALTLYELAKRAGGWEAEDDIVREGEDAGPGRGLRHAKLYRQHRAIERQSSHSREVKKRQGTRCRGCDFKMEEVYGEAAAGMIDAHHLLPLAKLADGQIATFDAMRDFAVLCPNCHRAIHRMEDQSDIAGLRALVKAGGLTRRPT